MTDLTETEIEEMVKRHPLPEGVEDAVLNREEMAEALATSLPSISSWINAGMPVQQVGGNGRSYELRLSHCWAWRQAQKDREDLETRKRREVIQAMRLALVGGENGDSLEALHPKDRRDILAVQIEQERFSAQRKQLMRRQDVEEMLETLLQLARDTMETAPDRLDRLGLLPPKSAEAFIEMCDGLLAEYEKRIRAFWELNREDRTSERRDLFDA